MHGRRGLGALAIATVIACGTPPRTHRPGEEWLAAIRIEGNHGLDADELEEGLSLYRAQQASRALDPYQLTVDTQRLRTAYLEHGYFDVTVTPRVDLKGVEQTVVFTVVEGRRSVAQVVFPGLPPDVPAASVRKLVALKDGAPFSYQAFDDAKLPIHLLLENAGYAHVRVDAAVLADRTRGVATLRYAIEPGPRSTFGTVTISGTEGQLADAIMDRLAFREGETYSAKALLDTQSAVYDLRRFSSVRVEIGSDTAAAVPVKITVSLADRHEVKLGGGLGYEPLTLELRGRAGGSYVNAAHPLWTFAGDLRPALTVDHNFSNLQKKARALLTAYRIDLFHARVRGEIELGADYLTYEAYTSKGPHARLGITAPLGAVWLQMHVGWVLEYLWFRDVHVTGPTRTELHLDHPQRRGAFEESLVADLRDDPLDPHRGAYLELRATEGSSVAGGAFNYVQVTPDIRGYVPLGKRVVLAARFRLGAILGDVPVTERYFSGGATSQRGFSERHLAPSAPVEDGGVLIGGAGLIETGVELRIPLRTVGGVPIGTDVFLDGGDVTLAASELALTHLHWAAGAGLWAKLGGVKIRIDVGYRLNRRGPGEPEYGGSGWSQNISPHVGIGDTY